MPTTAIIGAGLVGQGWAICFALARHDVRLWDASADMRDACLAQMATALEDMQMQGLCKDPAAALSRMQVAGSLADAVSAASYVQESVRERADIKTAVAQEIDAALEPGALVGSSSSGIPASVFTEGLKNRDRFFIVHPVNPPHLIPVVEIVPAPWSDKAHIPTIRALMEEIGQSPMLVEREIEGFILNRLQGALLNEAWALYEAGYASAEDIDRTVKDGLGRRWAFMGPFETIALNAPDGIADYAERLGPLYHSIAQSRTQPQPWSQETGKTLDEELSGGPGREARIKARDQKLMQIATLLRGA